MLGHDPVRRGTGKACHLVCHLVVKEDQETVFKLFAISVLESRLDVLAFIQAKPGDPPTAILLLHLQDGLAKAIHDHHVCQDFSL